MRLSIIIPVYNEEKYIKDVIQRIKDVFLPFAVLLVITALLVIFV